MIHIAFVYNGLRYMRPGWTHVYKILLIHKRRVGSSLEEQGLLRVRQFLSDGRIIEVIRHNIFWAAITISTAIASCLFQVTRFQESIQGVLIIWPIIGLLFAIIKSSMFGIQWRKLSMSDANADELFKKRGKVIFNVAGLVTIMATNTIMLTILLSKGIEIWHWTTFVTLIVAAGTMVIWYAARRKSRDKQLLIIGTGINIIPTYLQGVSYLFRGAAGMPMGSAVILLVMSFAMYRQSLPVYKGKSAAERRKQLRQALKEGKHPEVLLPKWDFICQVVAFGICWGIATFVLPSLGIGWWPLA